MAKKRRETTHLSRSSSTPYSRREQQHTLENTVDGDQHKNVKEWEEAVCPVCMEHPHNAVLLRCSSKKNGCRPYVCNTGVRHSDCLKKLFETSIRVPTSTVADGMDQKSPRGSIITCPFCRGHIHGWEVIDRAAREYMNSKPRSCSSSTCDFSGTYAELRKHVRSEHPLVCPREENPARQQMWKRLEQEREMLHLHETTAFSQEAISSMLVLLPVQGIDQLPGAGTYIFSGRTWRRLSSLAHESSSSQGGIQGEMGSSSPSSSARNSRSQ